MSIIKSKNSPNHEQIIAKLTCTDFWSPKANLLMDRFPLLGGVQRNIALFQSIMKVLQGLNDESDFKLFMPLFAAIKTPMGFVVYGVAQLHNVFAFGAGNWISNVAAPKKFKV